MNLTMTPAPRIYCIHDIPPDGDDALTRQLDACARMGFSHLMMSATTASGDALLSAPDLLARLIVAAKAAGLQVLLDVSVNASRKQGDAAPERDPPPDPRRPGLVTTTAAPSSVALSATAGVHDDAQVDWPRRLGDWWPDGAGRSSGGAWPKGVARRGGAGTAGRLGLQRGKVGGALTHGSVGTLAGLVQPLEAFGLGQQSGACGQGRQLAGQLGFGRQRVECLCVGCLCVGWPHRQRQPIS